MVVQLLADPTERPQVCLVEIADKHFIHEPLIRRLTSPKFFAAQSRELNVNGTTVCLRAFAPRETEAHQAITYPRRSRPTHHELLGEFVHPHLTTVSVQQRQHSIVRQFLTALFLEQALNLCLCAHDREARRFPGGELLSFGAGHR